MMRTVQVIIVHPNGPNTVQNGERRGTDAARSSKGEVVDYRPQAPTKTSSHTAMVRLRWMCHTRTAHGV